ncbi:MAG: hypothetical protein ACE5D7_08540 [Fidelibacterota bacterium]
MLNNKRLSYQLLIANLFYVFVISGCSDSIKSGQEASYRSPSVIYSGYRWWNYDILITDIFGNNITHLTRNEWYDREPVVTFDGRKLLFITDRDGNKEIYTMDLTWYDGYTKWKGENLTNVTNDSLNDGDAVFSPDGEQIVYLKYFPENDNYDIFLMNTDGSAKRNLSNTYWYEKKPQFSPDGTVIIYQSWKNNNADIFFMYLLELNQVNLTKDLHDDFLHLGDCFSPDGSQIVFSSLRDGNEEIYVMNIDGSGQMNLTNNSAWDSEPQFSPDGNQIVFTSDRDGNKEVYIMNTDGSDQKNLSNNPADDWAPRIYPDGKRVVFLTQRDGNWELYVMKIDGSDPQNISNNSGTDYSFTFLPVPE